MPGIAQIGLRAILDLTGFNKGRKEYSQGIDEMQTGNNAVGKSFDILNKSWSSLIGGIGSVTAAVYTLEKAFEFGREGAIISQTKDSFDNLMDSMGIMPGILDRMSKSTNGTVDDMTLMSSTMTLVAGTSNELGVALVQAAPQLLEIAKAANKLNPTLGDTSFLYESLANGIKRASPEMIDNIGLSVRIGEANEQMAAKLGKAVEGLTAEERQMALLTATLEAGDRMIEQAGGTTDSAVDSFDQLTTTMKNAADTIKQDLSPSIGELVQLYNDGVKFEQKFSKELRTIVAYASFLSDPNRFRSIAILGQDIGSGTPALEAWNKALGLGNMEMEETLRYAQEMATQFPEETRFVRDFGVATADAAGSTDALTAAQKELQKALEEARSKYEGFFGTLARGLVNYRDLADAQVQSATDYETALGQLQAKAAGVYQDVKLNFEASLPDKTTVAERMSMAGDAWDEWALRLQDIIQNGVASPWYAALQAMGFQKPPDVGVKEWAADLQEQFYAGELPELINAQAQAWQENTDKMKAAQADATAAYNTEVANRKAAVQGEIDALNAAREAQLAAEQQARNEATIALALSLAEQSGQLQAWSEQRFGPDFSQVANTAAEVLPLLQSGMLDIDTALQELIANNVAGIQTALDTTGTQAQETADQLDAIVTTDWAAEKQTQLAAALDPEIMPVVAVVAKAAEMGKGIVEKIPKTPFDPLLSSFEGVSGDISKEVGTLEKEMKSQFGDIDSAWSTMVDNQVTDWTAGMKEVNKAIQEQVIDKLAEIPSTITVTVQVVQAAGDTGKQAGGPVTAGVPYIVGEAGPELFVPKRAGTILPNLTGTMMRKLSMSLLGSLPSGGSTTNNSIGGDTFNFNVSSPQAWGMAQKWVDSRHRERLNMGM